MSSPLQTSPSGLLEAFGLRTQGDNPSRFGGEVLPTTEVGEYYLAQRRIAVVGQTAGAADATKIPSIVFTQPTILYGCTLQVSSGTNLAGLSWIDAYLRINANWPGGSPQWITLESWWEYYATAWTYPLVGHQWRRGWQSPYPLLLPAGTTFQGVWQANVATAADGAASLIALAAPLNPS